VLAVADLFRDSIIEIPTKDLARDKIHPTASGYQSLAAATKTQKAAILAAVIGIVFVLIGMLVNDWSEQRQAAVAADVGARLLAGIKARILQPSRPPAVRSCTCFFCGALGEVLGGQICCNETLVVQRPHEFVLERPDLRWIEESVLEMAAGRGKRWKNATVSEA
jgi:hypothetical protein